MKRLLAQIDRWTLVELAGAGLLGGGVWAEWGAPWACMFWGGLLLAVVALRGALGLHQTGRSSQ